MALYNPAAGIKDITGALSKKKEQGVNRMTITRVKSVKDPLTGEIVGRGPKEMYFMTRRDYLKHPMTEGENMQRTKWREACRLTSEILHNKSHPRYMELYQLWRAHLQTTDAPMQFPNFVRTVLSKEA